MSAEAEKREVKFDRDGEDVQITILDALGLDLASAKISLSMLIQATRKMMQPPDLEPEPRKPRGGRMHAVGKLIKADDKPPAAE